MNVGRLPYLSMGPVPFAHAPQEERFSVHLELFHLSSGPFQVLNFQNWTSLSPRSNKQQIDKCTIKLSKNIDYYSAILSIAIPAIS